MVWRIIYSLLPVHSSDSRIFNRVFRRFSPFIYSFEDFSTHVPFFHLIRIFLFLFHTTVYFISLLSIFRQDFKHINSVKCTCRRADQLSLLTHFPQNNIIVSYTDIRNISNLISQSSTIFRDVLCTSQHKFLIPCPAGCNPVHYRVVSCTIQDSSLCTVYRVQNPKAHQRPGFRHLVSRRFSNSGATVTCLNW